MDSKKLPLWLVFDNVDTLAPEPVYIIYKEGDDLRQDMLTLQMLGIMDKLWQEEGLDLRMSAYGCIATGSDSGMIEVVLNARTVASIQKAYGGKLGAFKEEPLRDWLRSQHPTSAAYETAVDNFVLSCAGYCVATYVLGIGDRHNDNIMLTTAGRLLHIDFGHFLGNIKRKFKIKREGFTPFVLTPDFVFLMGGKTSARFELFTTLCCRAYLIVRRHADVFLNLFAMMVSTGIPELKTSDDVRYIRDHLCMGKSDEDAEAEMRRLINVCFERSWTTQFNWYIHSVAH